MKRFLVVTLMAFVVASVGFAAAAAEQEASSERITLTVWTNSNMEAFPPGQDENNNPIHAYLEEKTGYKLHWLIGSQENALAKLSLLLASGDPPDLLSPISRQFFGELVNQRVLYELDELIEKRGSIFKRDDVVPAGLWLAARSGGHTYGIPQQGAVQSLGGPLIRKDWLDEAGLEVPTTIEDFYNVLQAFKTMRPESIPMTGDTNSVRGGISPFAGHFNAAVIYAESNGKVIDTRVTDDMKEFLGFLARLVREELLDQEYVINKGKNIKEKVAGGKVGLFSSAPWGLRDLLPAFEEKNPGGKYIFIAPAIDKNGNAGVRERNPIRGFATIAADSKHPDEAFDFLVKYASSREIQDFVSYGVEGVHYNRDSNGIITATEAGAARKHNIYYVIWNTPDAHLMRAKMKGFWPVYEPTFKYSLYKDVTSYAPPIADLEAVKTQLADLTDEMFDKIIIGAEPLSAFDEYKRQWKQLGGQKALDAVNAWYASTQ